jgi:hypothetical protein
MQGLCGRLIQLPGEQSIIEEAIAVRRIRMGVDWLRRRTIRDAHIGTRGRLVEFAMVPIHVSFVRANPGVAVVLAAVLLLENPRRER